MRGLGCISMASAVVHGLPCTVQTCLPCWAVLSMVRSGLAHRSRQQCGRASRNPDSPYIAPTLGDGQLVRFASHATEAGGPDGWGRMRIACLQYSNDPIIFYESASLLRSPAWMNEAPGPDVSPDMQFMRVATRCRLAVDLP
ncbi:hypothetical protein FGD77_17640 [Roseovarius sp. M141]|nr:hypothetical protein [Roseovarius sp. M141]